MVEKNGTEAVVDLKLSGLKYRQSELEDGRYLQISLYASLLTKRGEALPPSGFFVMQEGQFLTADPQVFPGATVVDGPSASATLAGAEKRFAYWSKVLAKGVLPVLHNKLAWEVPVTAAAGPLPAEDSPARRPSPCRFCNYQSICVPAPIDDEEVNP